jgi:NTE family protein
MKPYFHSFTWYCNSSILTVLIVIFSLPGVGASGQTKEPGKRPSVGLVLSGGGAHGLAHIGVIRVMEEAGLRPDYITGVSMGSIVGGMYAIGYSADSLYKLFLKLNWDALLSNKIPENKVIFHEKYNLYNSIVSLPVTSKKVLFPSGLINGQLIENTLSLYAWPAADINDFSKLPIPYMCLGTDIITYKKVKLKTGYLPDAIRASFSVPSIFTPLKIDTLLLVDGGLVRNFAASEAKEMGADILIGSYVGFNANTEEELQSVTGIMKQIAMFRSLEDFREQKKLVDVLITPQVKELPITGFGNVEKLAQKGYEAALPYKEYFKKLADSLDGIEPQKPLVNILNKKYYTFDKIEIRGNESFSDEQILGVLDIDPGEKVDKYILSDRIELLYGEAWFDKVKYRIVPRNDSLILNIDCIEKPQAMLYGSVHYDNAIRSGLKIGLSVKNLLSERSLINLNTYIGQYFRVDFNAIQFVGRNQKSDMAINFLAENTLIPTLTLFQQNGAVISRDFIQGLSVGRRFGLNHMLNVFLDYENLNLLTKYDSDINLKSLSYNYITEGLDYSINTLDSKHFPDKGLVFHTMVSTSRLYSGTIEKNSELHVNRNNNHGEFLFDRFFTVNGDINKYFSPSQKTTIGIGGNLLFINKTDSASARNNFYLLGGITKVDRRSIPAIGYQANEIPVKTVAGIRGDFDYEFYSDLHLELTANIFALQEVDRKSGFALISGFGAGLGYMSVIGPIRLGIMYGGYSNPDFFNKTKGYLSIGFNF